MITLVLKWIGYIAIAEVAFAFGWSFICVRAERREAERADHVRRVAQFYIEHQENPEC